MPDLEPTSRLPAARDSTHRLSAWAHLLPTQDRAFLEDILLRGHSHRHLASLLSVQPRTVARRLERLIRRVGSPKFLFVGSHLPRFAPTRRRIAEAVVLHGLSIRTAAQRLSLPLHTVRRHADAIHALFESSSRAALDPVAQNRATPLAPARPAARPRAGARP